MNNKEETKMSFKEITNEKGDYKILAEGIRDLKIDYNDRPYSRYSQESMQKARELKAAGKVRFDGPGVRLSEHTFDENGNLSLSLDYTTYAMFMATRKNTGNQEDNARWLGCSGITIIKDGNDYFMWVGEKSSMNEVGAGQIQLTPAGGIDPTSDFGLATTVKRELHEEALTKKVWDLRIDRNLAIEMFGEERFTKKGDLYVMDRDFLEVESRIKVCQPYMLADFLSMSSLNLVHLLRLDYSKKEIEESFEAIPKKEFSFLVALEWKKEFLKDYLNDKHDNLRPTARAALDSVIRNWDYVNEELRKSI